MSRIYRPTKPIRGMLVTGKMETALEKDVTSSSESAIAFLKRDFLRSTARQLYNARKAAGLSQTQLSKILQTTQSVISRTEADLSGSISLKRYVEWLVACQRLPRRLEVVSLKLATVVARETLDSRKTTSATIDDFTTTVAYLHGGSSVNPAVLARGTEVLRALNELNSVTKVPSGGMLNAPSKRGAADVLDILKKRQSGGLEYLGVDVTTTNIGDKAASFIAPPVSIFGQVFEGGNIRGASSRRIVQGAVWHTGRIQRTAREAGSNGRS